MDISRIKTGDIIVTIECSVSKWDGYKDMCFSFYRIINSNPSFNDDNNSNLSVVDSITIEGDFIDDCDILLYKDDVSQNEIINLKKIVENINTQKRVENDFTIRTWGYHFKDSKDRILWRRLVKNISENNCLQSIEELIGIRLNRKNVIFRNDV